MNWGKERHMRSKRTLYALALSFALGATSNILAADPTFTQGLPCDSRLIN